MLKNICADSVTTAAKVIAGRIGNMRVGALEVSAVVGGTSHAEAEFADHVLNVTLRKAGGEAVPILKGARMVDLMKVADFKHGWSLQAEGDDGTRYVCYIPLGLYKLEGDDEFQIALNCGGHATATYDYRIGAVEGEAGPELMLGYETLTGNGAEQFIKDCLSLYLTTAAGGVAIPVSDQVGSSADIDSDLADLANSVGEMEMYEDLAVLYNDPFRVGQDVRVKLPANSFALAQVIFFDPGRLASRMGSDEQERRALIAKIAQGRPEKLESLRMLDMI